MRTLVSIRFGSHLYGTATAASDLDLKAVHVPAARDILLGRAKGSISTKRAKAEGEKPRAPIERMSRRRLKAFHEARARAIVGGKESP